MLQPVLFNNLIVGETYQIHVGQNYYYIGTFIQPVVLHVVEHLGVFDEMRCVHRNANPRCFLSPSPQYFRVNRMFYRHVDNLEIMQKYREAFERRATNQIISFILGHVVQFY